MKYSLIFYNYETKKLGHINLGLTTIKDITIFTSQFNNEQELKNYLLQNNLLPQEFINYNLGILSPKSKKLLKYGITYKKDLKYFNTNDLNEYYDTSFIKEYFITHLNNASFMEAFIDEFYDILSNVHVFTESLNFLNLALYNLKNRNYIEEKSEYHMNFFLEKYTTRRTKNGHKNNFTNIRYLAMFISNYEKIQIKELNDSYNKYKYINRYYDYSIEELEKEYQYYQYLILRSDLTDDDRNAYNSKLNEIDQEFIRRMLRK